MPTKRALGINWDVKNDKLGFIVNLGDKPYVRKGMLSMINKIYDPLGITFLVEREKKRIPEQFSWDKQVSAETIEEWEQWKNDLKLLENIDFNKCFKSPKF